MTNSFYSINQLIRDQDIPELGQALSGISSFEIADLIVNQRSAADQVIVFSSLPPKLAVQTLDYLPNSIQKMLLNSAPKELITEVLIEMPPDDRTNLLLTLPRATIDECLKRLPLEERTIAISLLGYPEDTVGHLMTTDYLAVKLDWTIEKVLDHIRSYGHDSETIEMIYVIDDENRLVDDIAVRNLLFIPKDKTVSQISDKKFLALSVYDSDKEAIHIFKQCNRLALPAVDEHGIMKGIVTIDDILRAASEIHTETMQKIGGIEAFDESYMTIPFIDLIKKRARWLIIIFIGEMFTATAMAFFEHQIEKAVVLALFLPLIISSGGNAGSQSSTLIIRSLALGELQLKDWWRILNREILSGLALGGILGIIGFFRVTIWSGFSSIYGAHWLLIAYTICTALLFVVLWGSIAGAMLPLILKKFKYDPAVASAPLVATLVDVTGIIIYFLAAMWILSGTLL